MRTIRPLLIAITLLGVIVAGCAGSSDPLTRSVSTAPSVFAPSVAAAPAQLICGKNERICTSCDGTRQFCGQFCPDCTPVLHDRTSTTPSDVALAPGSESVPATLALHSTAACADAI